MPYPATRSRLLLLLLFGLAGWSPMARSAPPGTLPPAPDPQDGITQTCRRGAAPECLEGWRNLTLLSETMDQAQAIRLLGPLLHSASALRVTDQPKPAVLLLQETLGVIAGVLGPQHPLLVEPRIQLAEALIADNQPKAAQRLLDEIGAQVEATLGPEHLYGAWIAALRARLAQRADRDEEAARWLSQRLAIQEGFWLEGHPTLATPLSRLGALRQHQNQREEAAHLLERALDLLPADHPAHRASRLSLLERAGSLCLLRGFPDRASGRLEEGLQLAEATWGEDHPAVIPFLATLAYSLMAQNRYLEAEKLLGRALVTATRHHGPQHRQTGLLLLDMARVMTHLGQAPVARQVLQRASLVLAPFWDRYPEDRVVLIQRMAGTFVAEGKRPEGEAYLRQGIQTIVEERGGATGPHPALRHLLESHAQMVEGMEEPGSHKGELSGAKQIRELQRRLGGAGLDPGTTSGEPTPETLEAANRFAAALGLPPLKKLTRESLDRILRHLPPPPLPAEPDS